MEWNEEQKANILRFYDSIEEYERIMKVNEARQYLEDTDYVVIKLQEYKYLGKEIDNNYTEILEKRELAREVIRDNEMKVNG